MVLPTWKVPGCLTEQFEHAVQQEVALLNTVASWGPTSPTQQGLAPRESVQGNFFLTLIRWRNVKILSCHKFLVPFHDVHLVAADIQMTYFDSKTLEEYTFFFLFNLPCRDWQDKTKWLLWYIWYKTGDNEYTAASHIHFDQPMAGQTWNI